MLDGKALKKLEGFTNGRPIVRKSDFSNTFCFKVKNLSIHYKLP